MVSCCAFGCKCRSSSDLQKEKGISFHSFPNEATDKERRQKWIHNIRRKNFIVKQYTKICSLHFLEEMFDRTGQITRLKENAVPTLFDFPKLPFRLYQKQKASTRSCPVAKPTSKDADSQSVCSDHKYYIQGSPRKIKHQLEGEIEVLKKKLKSYQTKLSKSNSNITSLKAILKKLTEKSSHS